MTVILGNRLEEIKKLAFNGCLNLTTVILGNGLEEIGELTLCG